MEPKIGLAYNQHDEDFAWDARGAGVEFLESQRLKVVVLGEDWEAAKAQVEAQKALDQDSIDAANGSVGRKEARRKSSQDLKGTRYEKGRHCDGEAGAGRDLTVLGNRAAKRELSDEINGYGLL